MYTISRWGIENTVAKRLCMRQVEHFSSLFQSHFPLRSKSSARLASFCEQLVVQLFCFMLLVFLSINCFMDNQAQITVTIG